MLTIQTFAVGLLITSALTGLVTEAIKKILTEYSKTYRANTLAGIVSTVLSICIGSGYIIMSNLEFTSQNIVSLVALVFMSWLCSMVGYDKVLQTIEQIKMGKTQGDE